MKANSLFSVPVGGRSVLALILAFDTNVLRKSHSKAPGKTDFVKKLREKFVILPK